VRLLIDEFFLVPIGMAFETLYTRNSKTNKVKTICSEKYIVY